MIQAIENTSATQTETQIDQAIQEWYNAHNKEDAACKIDTVIAYLLVTHKNEIIRHTATQWLNQMVDDVVSKKGFEEIVKQGDAWGYDVLVKLLRGI